MAGDSHTLVLQHLNRLQNTNDVLIADASTGSMRQIYRDQDKAWVDVFDKLQWVHGGKDFLWVSEQDGWRHAYLVSRDGKSVRLLTAGDSDVIEILGIAPEEDWLYYLASPENATQRYLYRVRVDGSGKAQRLSSANEPGTHSYDISPDFHWAIHTYSTLDSPPRIDLKRIPEQRVVRVLEDNSALRASLKDVFARPAEFVQVDVGQGVVLDAWMVKPAAFDAAKKYPVLVYVYGEPAGQTVIDGWEGERDLFHRTLAEKGYVVLSIDNRGTPAPKGRAEDRAWKRGRAVVGGTNEGAEIADAKLFVPGCGSDRGVGLERRRIEHVEPDVSIAVGLQSGDERGAGCRSTVVRHDLSRAVHGAAAANPDGYKAGSPINFAEGLKGTLLIVHSPGDDNVHFRGTELLINRLVELGKPFDFMEYPGRTHSLSEGMGTHYHLYSLMARYLEEHIKPIALAR
jgi:dipeptidyl-peptidase 4